MPQAAGDADQHREHRSRRQEVFGQVGGQPLPVGVELALEVVFGSPVLVPDDRARLIGQRMTGAQDAHEGIQVLPAPRGRPGPQRLIEPAPVSEHARPKGHVLAGAKQPGRVRMGP